MTDTAQGALAGNHDAATAEPLLASLPSAQQMLGGLGKTKLYELINDGVLDTVHIGNRHLVTVSSIRRVAESGA